MQKQSTSNGQVSTVLMTREEAESWEGRFSHSIQTVQVELAEFVDREGWRALGFDSPKAWKEARYPNMALSTFYGRVARGRELAPPSITGAVKLSTPATAPKSAPAHRPMGAKDKAPRYRAEPAPDPPRGPFIPQPKPLPPDNMVTCRHCGGTGLVPAPTKAAPSLSLPYYCASCGKAFQYYSPRCPQCRALNTLKSR